MQQAIPKALSGHRQPGANLFRDCKQSFRLIGNLAGELAGLASLVAALTAGMAGLLWLLG